MDSQASRQLDWCLSKAKKEVEECREQKKKIRHRGLLKIEPNKKLALAHLQKARHNLEVLKLLRKNKASDWSVAAGFYTIYHCFLAIAAKHGYESKNQTCTIALIETLQEQGEVSINPEIIAFMKYNDDENLPQDSIIELRENYTYGVDLEVENKEQLDKIEKLCIEFLEFTKNIVY
jgi:uncharacterized protein (UPF0332 family)